MDRRTILECILKIYINTRNWVDSVQDRDYWRALVDALLYLWVAEPMEVVSYYYCYIPKFLKIVIAVF